MNKKLAGLLVIGIAALNLVLSGCSVEPEGPTEKASNIVDEAIEFANSPEGRKIAQTAGEVVGTGASLVGEGVEAVKETVDTNASTRSTNNGPEDPEDGSPNFELGFTLGFGNKTSMYEAQAYKLELEAEAESEIRKAEAETAARIASSKARYADQLADLEVAEEGAKLEAKKEVIDAQLEVDLAAIDADLQLVKHGIEEQKKAKVAEVNAQIALHNLVEDKANTDGFFYEDFVEDEVNREKAKTGGLIAVIAIAGFVLGGSGLAWVFYWNLRAPGKAIVETLEGITMPRFIGEGPSYVVTSILDQIRGVPPTLISDLIPSWAGRFPKEPGGTVHAPDSILAIAAQATATLVAHAEAQDAEDRRHARDHQGGAIAKVVEAAKNKGTIIKRASHVHTDK